MYGDISEQSQDLEHQQHSLTDELSHSNEELDAEADPGATQNFPATEHCELQLREAATVTVENIMGMPIANPADQVPSPIMNDDINLSCVEEDYNAANP
ncbi:hypothetical protein HJC23_001427 [Cyclotella cryptica]|uniref:Uncharacterized protein n=1 Tax=Cyclotella cryptica TaxID=29204 RepID=A0ABD3NNQ5_9STRA